MIYTWYELGCYLLIYSFIGWLAEIVFAAFDKKKFLNRGFLNGPICPIYGFSMVFVLVFFDSLRDQPIFLFLGCMAVTTVLEFLTGSLMEKIFKRKWWDYSGYTYNIGGYVCLGFSALWGIGAVLLITFVHPFIRTLLLMVPGIIGNIVVIALLGMVVIDFCVTVGAILKVKLIDKRMQEIARNMQELADGMQELSDKLGGAISSRIQKRMVRAFPNLKDEQSGKIAVARKEEKSAVFATGCGFYKLVWMFFIGALLGDIIETIFCRITVGVWMSRSSVLYGPFSIVWGLAIVLASLLLYRVREKDDRYIFVFGTVLGGAYEYICSVFTEIVFGTVFWDYSKIPFNLGGRINLLYCFFWGIAAIIWIKHGYPLLSKYIEKIPSRIGKPVTIAFVVFMTVNMLLSGLALSRYTERITGAEPSNVVEEWMDELYPDAHMDKVYPNAIMK